MFHHISVIIRAVPLIQLRDAFSVHRCRFIQGTFRDASTRKKGSLHLHQSIPGCRRQPSFVHLVAKVSLIVVLGVLFLGISFGVQTRAAHAQSAVAQSTNTSTQAHKPPTGAYNWFAYPWCAWWADERYHELHGVYVPWSTQSDAWEWTARAYQFGWSVSTKASPGAIIDLQPWVQWAYGLGHVAVVEQVYSDGSVLASNTSWGADPYQVAYFHFYPGPGVTFIQW